MVYIAAVEPENLGEVYIEVSYPNGYTDSSYRFHYEFWHKDSYDYESCQRDCMIDEPDWPMCRHVGLFMPSVKSGLMLPGLNQAVLEIAWNIVELWTEGESADDLQIEIRT